MKDYTHKSARQAALKDISEYMKNKNIQVVDKFGDVWYVSSYMLGCMKECAKLNAELGISGVNKIGNKNGFRSKSN